MLDSPVNNINNYLDALLMLFVLFVLMDSFFSNKQTKKKKPMLDSL